MVLSLLDPTIYTKLLIIGLLTCILSDFPCPEPFSFGSVAGDLPGPTGDDSASNPVTLVAPFTFIGMEYNQVYVRINSTVFVCSIPMLAILK